MHSLSVSLVMADHNILASLPLSAGEYQFRKLEVLSDVKLHSWIQTHIVDIHRHTDTCTLNKHQHHWWAVGSILYPGPGDNYKGPAWLQEFWSAGSAALIPDTRDNVNPSKGIFFSQAFVSYLKNCSFKSCRWGNWDHRKCWTDDTAYFLNNV